MKVVHVVNDKKFGGCKEDEINMMIHGGAKEIGWGVCRRGGNEDNMRGCKK